MPYFVNLLISIGTCTLAKTYISHLPFVYVNTVEDFAKLDAFSNSFLVSQLWFSLFPLPLLAALLSWCMAMFDQSVFETGNLDSF